MFILMKVGLMLLKTVEKVVNVELGESCYGSCWWKGQVLWFAGPVEQLERRKNTLALMVADLAAVVFFYF